MKKVMCLYLAEFQTSNINVQPRNYSGGLGCLPMHHCPQQILQEELLGRKEAYAALLSTAALHKNVRV